MVRWIWFCVASIITIALFTFIGYWTFSLPLVVAIVVAWVAYGLLIYFGTRRTEAKPLVMNESKWLDTEADRD